MSDNVIDLYDNEHGYVPICCRPGGRCTPEGNASAKPGSDVAESLKDIAELVRADLAQAKADCDSEQASYFRGELAGILRAHDLLAAAQEEQQ